MITKKIQNTKKHKTQNDVTQDLANKISQNHMYNIRFPYLITHF